MATPCREDERMDISRLTGPALAIALFCLLAAALCLVPVYPCGFWEAGELYDNQGYAGHGYYSLVEVLGHGFFWTADEVPTPFLVHNNPEPPYYAVGYWWVSVLYIPIFIAMAYVSIEASRLAILHIAPA